MFSFEDIIYNERKNKLDNQINTLKGATVCISQTAQKDYVTENEKTNFSKIAKCYSSCW